MTMPSACETSSQCCFISAGNTASFGNSPYVSPGESKPATLRRELHITYSIWFKGKTGLFARLLFWMESTAVIVFLGWFDRAGSVGLFSAAGGDRALQECNPSTHAVRGLRMHPLPASASSGAGSFAFGNASQPRPKAKNSSSFSRRSRC